MLVLDKGAYTNLVNRPSASTLSTGEILVIPGDATNSLLVKRISGITGNLAQMPLGGVLPATDITLIKTWITEGAKNN